ncbi:putative reverse transcriptase domain-containing protein [Tanacetum coccineum]
MSHRSSVRANDSANSESEPEASSSCEIMLQVATWLKTFKEFTRGWVRLGYLDVDTQPTWMQHDYREIKAESRNARIMAGRSARCNTANNTNPPKETADEVARQLNTALDSGAKEFFGTEGAFSLLTWFESIEFVLHITKCPTKSQVKFASSMLQGRALTWWNTLVQTRGRAAAITQPWEDFKKLLMEEYSPDDEIQKLETEF